MGAILRRCAHAVQGHAANFIFSPYFVRNRHPDWVSWKAGRLFAVGLPGKLNANPPQRRRS
jgi:hypothetical protein